MWHRTFVISSYILSVCAIIVPIENKQEVVTETTKVDSTNGTEEAPDYYSPEDPRVDSYLAPPSPHKLQEVVPDSVVTPATYLLPPSSDQDAQFYYPHTEAGEQSDWYPIAHVPPLKEPSILSPPKRQAIPIFLIEQGPPKREKLRMGKSYSGDRYTPPQPSIRLEPPPPDASNEYPIPHLSEQLNLHPSQTKLVNTNSYKTQYTDGNGKLPSSDILLQNKRPSSEEPVLAVHLTPPKPSFNQHKYPTNLYPKKYSGGFIPVPIPVAQFVEDPSAISRTKPVNYLKHMLNDEQDYIPNAENKKIYLYKEAEQKRKLKAEDAVQPQVESIRPKDDPEPSEQETSETNHRYPGPNVYSARIREAPRPAPQRAKSTRDKSPPAPDERTEFRMHGMKGPHSYQFGYDTGKGKNRQFRYEERDNDGQIRGHYGYMDKHGKLRVVNYRAHPELGFHAEAPVENE